MIKHHPSIELLTKFSAAELPATLSVAVGIHVEMCSVCQQKVAQLEAQNAEEAFAKTSTNEQATTDSEHLFDVSMLTDIIADTQVDEVYENPAVSINVQQKEYTLPRALSRLGRSKFLQLGKLSRSRIDLEDGSLRASLLHIGENGEIPHHTHTGFEVTLLLDGEFSDEFDNYVAGDFMMLDNEHQHSPHTKEGCLCFTVVSSALHFNKGLSKLLNPIGNLIY